MESKLENQDQNGATTETKQKKKHRDRPSQHSKMGIVIFDFSDKPRDRCTHGKTSQVAGGVGQLCCYTTLRSHDQAYVVLPWASKVSAAITHEQAIKDNCHQIIISRGIRECSMGPAIPAN